MTPPIIEKWCTFYVTRDGRWDVELFTGERAPNQNCFRVRLTVPAELLGQDIEAEVAGDEQQIQGTATKEKKTDGKR